MLPTGARPKGAEENTTRALLPSKAPKWHAPWKLYRVSGHTGWVRAVDVEPENQWFASGGADRIIKIWDLATGKLKLSLTGHISAVRAVKISNRHPFLFSGGEDKQLKCWDLEYNNVIRHYYGHLSAIQAIAYHPTLDVLVSAARDSTASNLPGHNAIVNSLACNQDGVLVSGGDNGSMRFWDWKSGFCFQSEQVKPQPGSIDSEAGIYAMCFDKTGLRLITAEADKTIKMYKEDDSVPLPFWRWCLRCAECAPADLMDGLFPPIDGLPPVIDGPSNPPPFSAASRVGHSNHVICKERTCTQGCICTDCFAQVQEFLCLVEIQLVLAVQRQGSADDIRSLFVQRTITKQYLHRMAEKRLQIAPFSFLSFPDKVHDIRRNIPLAAICNGTTSTAISLSRIAWGWRYFLVSAVAISVLFVYRTPIKNAIIDYAMEQGYERAKERAHESVKVAEREVIMKIPLVLRMLDQISGLVPLVCGGWMNQPIPHFPSPPLALMETGTDILGFWVARLVALTMRACIDSYGRLIGGTPLDGIDRFDARTTVLSQLQSLGALVESKEAVTTTVSLCSRTGDIIEPRQTHQWFLDCRQMHAEAATALRDGRLSILPPSQGERLLDWWFNYAEPWCLSRQLVWGHRIPAWNVEGTSKWIVQNSANDAREGREEGVKLIRDPDVLDTWFSSGLVPLVCGGWMNQPIPHFPSPPLSLMETGTDILGFWVARMVALTMRLSGGQVPFPRVILHGMVRDAEGRKMSKSIGNVVDPLDVIDGISLQKMEERLGESALSEKEKATALSSLRSRFRCGADSLRFALLRHDVLAADVPIDIGTLASEGLRFCNKLWNLAAYAVEVRGRVEKELAEGEEGEEHVMDSWLRSRLASSLQSVDSHMEETAIHLAFADIHSFVLTALSDVYVESTKSALWSDDKRRLVAISRTIDAVLAESPVTYESTLVPGQNARLVLIEECHREEMRNVLEEKLEKAVEKKVLYLQNAAQYEEIAREERYVLVYLGVTKRQAADGRRKSH